MGFQLNHKDDQSAFLAIGGKGGLILGLVSVNEVARLISEKQVRPREETVHRIYYAVFVEDVDREYEELKQKGVHFREAANNSAVGPADSVLRGSRRKLLGNLPLPQEVGNPNEDVSLPQWFGKVTQMKQTTAFNARSRLPAPQQTHPLQQPTIREIVRETVVVQSRYCGARAPQGTLRCPGCGAKL